MFKKIVILVALSLGFFVFNYVISEKTDYFKDTPSTLMPTPTIAPTESDLLSKTSYKIALYGDSLIDTMVDAQPSLETQLKAIYPKTLFKVYNYGIGAQNVNDGLERWDKPFSNRDREYPPIKNIKPDILIIGSFAYNPFSPHDPNKHKESLTELVKKAKQTTARVFLLAEIAPLGDDFGTGIKGVNWTPKQSQEHSRHIIEQLQNVFAVGKELNVPVIDAYTPSKAEDSEFGKRELVNVDDGIHPSPEGHDFTAKIIISTIALK
ncbi:MAG: GDSL-type esterase/lipase family protein [Patescibacteria group bacterium]